jgi:hypothetical protein
LSVPFLWERWKVFEKGVMALDERDRKLMLIEWINRCYNYNLGNYSLWVIWCWWLIVSSLLMRVVRWVGGLYLFVSKMVL